MLSTAATNHNKCFMVSGIPLNTISGKFVDVVSALLANGVKNDLLQFIIEDLNFVNKYYLQYEMYNVTTLGSEVYDLLQNDLREMQKNDLRGSPLPKEKIIEKTNEYIVALGKLVIEIKKEMNKKTNFCV